MRLCGTGIGLSIVLASVAVSGFAAGGIAPTIQEFPEPGEVIARHVRAIGGRDAVLAHSSSRATGTLEVVGQGLTGEMTIYGAAPDRTLVMVSFAAAGMESRTGYDGEVGWSTDPMTGERLLQSGELQQLVDEADFYGDLHDPKDYASMETVGMVEFGGRKAYKLKLVYQSGRENFEYFDAEEGHLIGIEGAQESLMGSINVVTRVDGYRQFGDLMVPTTMVQEFGPGQTVSVTIETVEWDSVDDSVFDLPPAIKALVRD